MTIILSGCSSQPIILTDEYAYYSDDDSLSVIAGFNKIHHQQDSLNKSDSDTTVMTPPLVIERIEPEYPSYHVGQSSYLIEANIFVRAWITKEGKVKRVYIIKSSEKTFNKVCLEAAMKWKFSPATKKGKPVSCWISIPFRFRLSKDRAG